MSNYPRRFAACSIDQGYTIGGAAQRLRMTEDAGALAVEVQAVIQETIKDLEDV